MSETALDIFLRKIAGDPQFRAAAPSGKAYVFVSPPEANRDSKRMNSERRPIGSKPPAPAR